MDSETGGGGLVTGAYRDGFLSQSILTIITIWLSTRALSADRISGFGLSDH